TIEISKRTFHGVLHQIVCIGGFSRRCQRKAPKARQERHHLRPEMSLGIIHPVREDNGRAGANLPSRNGEILPIPLPVQEGLTVPAVVAIARPYFCPSRGPNRQAKRDKDAAFGTIGCRSDLPLVHARLGATWRWWPRRDRRLARYRRPAHPEP